MMMSFSSSKLCVKFLSVDKQSYVIKIRNGASILNPNNTRTIISSTKVSFKDENSSAAAASTTTITKLANNTESMSTATSSATQGPPSVGTTSSSTGQSYQEFLQNANHTMLQYHTAKELMKQGKLPNLRIDHKNNAANQNTVMIQVSIVAVFLIAFMSMPILGKKIAKDDEFRKKYIPKWYDYTVTKPNNPWTRQELHEQMIQVQNDLHQRAIAGEFHENNIKQMRNSGKLILNSTTDNDGEEGKQVVEESAKSINSMYKKEWDRIHPGIDNDEKVGEE